MHIASALRRKRDEIAATIAAYEARIDAARMDLAALEQAARLFDPEAERDEPAIHRAMGQLALPVARAKGSDDQDAGPFKSIGVRERQFTAKVAHPAAQAAREQIPGGFFYLDWP
jgi:hypothetical protein